MDSQQSDLVKHVLDAGFPLNAASLIHLFVGGSQLHGAKVSGYDDLDIYGCYIEPPERILGVLALEHFVWSSGSATEKNTADDVDVTTYSLHRWGELIRKGNPAILHYLFAANALSSDTWERSGKYTQDQVFGIGDGLAHECEQLLQESDLPEAVDAELLSRQIADAYKYHWRTVGSM
jgi:predicted nucleotidyltransferase